LKSSEADRSPPFSAAVLLLGAASSPPTWKSIHHHRRRDPQVFVRHVQCSSAIAGASARN